MVKKQKRIHFTFFLHAFTVKVLGRQKQRDKLFINLLDVAIETLGKEEALVCINISIHDVQHLTSSTSLNNTVAGNRRQNDFCCRAEALHNAIVPTWRSVQSITQIGDGIDDGANGDIVGSHHIAVFQENGADGTGVVGLNAQNTGSSGENVGVVHQRSGSTHVGRDTNVLEDESTVDEEKGVGVRIKGGLQGGVEGGVRGSSKGRADVDLGASDGARLED